MLTIAEKSVVVIGGQWWWRRSLGVLREGLGEEKEEEDGSFTLLDVFVACNTRPGEFVLAQNFLLR